MDERLKKVLNEMGVSVPKFGSIEIVFRDGNAFDIISTDRVRINEPRHGKIKERT